MVVMKKTLLYIALAVAATAFATSCVKELVDETTDNTDKVEVTGQVFEGVMEDTKSVIEGNTPTWVDGDAISIFGSNQEVALECTYLGENKFQSKESTVVEGPYYAIYPHKDGHTVDQATGIFTATVPSEQLIAAGQNVAAGALVSVAASETTELYFRNAVGLVRLENKREDIVSIKIESTTADQVIAGEFTMDLNPDKETEDEDPAITLVEGKGATSITLKPAEENGTLAAGEYYATLLPCAIDGIKVTFTRKNGEKTESVTVTKAKETTIPRNGGANLGAFFTYEIKTAADLLAWNKAAAKWTAWDVVTLNSETGVINCADVITSENWTPNIFAGTFDGNNQTIDNFVIELAGPAAFIKKTYGNAVIKNLTFGENCSFTTTLTTGDNGMGITKNRMYAASAVCEVTGQTVLSNIINYGAVSAVGTSASNGNYIAGIAASHESLGIITNCENHGSVTFKTDPASWLNLGGCFGQVTRETTLDGCKNHGTVSFSGTNNSKNSRLNIGGITGGANIVTFKNCQNLGKVEHNATASHGGQVNLGGFIGYNNAAVVKSFENCSNGSLGTSLGAITNNSETTGVLCMGGCIAYINGYNTCISSFKNFAPITNNKNLSNAIVMGGIVGQIQNASKNSVTDCENHGAIKNAPETSGSLYAGGLVGWLNKANTSFNNVINEATIAAHGAHKTSGKHCSLGGIIGYSSETTNTITNASNTASVSSWSTSGDFKSSCEIGGIIGFINGGVVVIGNETKDGIKNSGTLTVKRAVDFSVGGAVGKAYGAALTITNAKNAQKIVQDGWANDPSIGNGLGGILGIGYSAEAAGTKKISISNCINEGAVEKAGASVGTVDKVHLGGIVGHLVNGYLEADIIDCTNKASVTFLPDGNTYRNSKSATYTGGIVGFFACSGKLENCTNSGTVKNNINANNETSVQVGGIVGGAGNGSITDCLNTGSVLDNNKADSGQIGGIAGSILTRAMTMSGCNNSGAVSGKFDGTTARNARVGGLVGMSYVNITMNDCHNTGSVTQLNSKNTEYLGGLVGQIEKNLTTVINNCSCKATVTPAKTSYNYSGLIVGRLTDKIVDGDKTCTTTVSDVTVGGTFAGVPITADNYGTYTFGTSSDYGKISGHATTGITFAE